MIPLVSEVLCGLDLETVNQVLVHLLHFSTGAEEEPGRDMSLFSFCCPLPKVQQYIHCLPKIRQVILCLLSCFLLAILEDTAASSTQLDRHTKTRSMSCISCLLRGLLLCGCYIHSNPHHSKKHVFFGAYSPLSFLTQNHTSLPAWNCTTSTMALP